MAKVTMSSGNVFADLGLPHPEECLAKAELISRIEDIMQAEGLTQEQAAARMGFPRTALCKLLKGDTRGFSLDRLIRRLKALGQDVEIRVRPVAARQNGHLSTVLDALPDEWDRAA